MTTICLKRLNPSKETESIKEQAKDVTEPQGTLGNILLCLKKLKMMTIYLLTRPN